MEGRRVSVCNDEGFAIMFFDPNRYEVAQVHSEGGRGDRLLVLLAVLARVRGAEFDLAVHAGEG